MQNSWILELCCRQTRGSSTETVLPLDARIFHVPSVVTGLDFENVGESSFPGYFYSCWRHSGLRRFTFEGAGRQPTLMLCLFGPKADHGHWIDGDDNDLLFTSDWEQGDPYFLYFRSTFFPPVLLAHLLIISLRAVLGFGRFSQICCDMDSVRYLSKNTFKV